ncbi:MAG: hypothetical protein WC358_10315, partial [Ignavibacteria bacterium]
MFDFFQIIDFNGKHNIKNAKYSFLKLYLYDKVEGIEYFKDFKNSKACFLEREKTDKNCFNKKGKNIFLFGTVYTNDLYKEVSGHNLQIIYADFICELLDKYDDDIVKYIKGSFVIVIYDELKNNVKVISDRLNVLPLYYSFKDNLLIISSSV